MARHLSIVTTSSLGKSMDIAQMMSVETWRSSGVGEPSPLVDCECLRFLQFEIDVAYLGGLFEWRGDEISDFGLSRRRKYCAVTQGGVITLPKPVGGGGVGLAHTLPKN